jgi:hypothetical protein
MLNARARTEPSALHAGDDLANFGVADGRLAEHEVFGSDRVPTGDGGKPGSR